MVKNSADRRKKAAKTLKLMWNLKWIYLMLLPVVAYYIIFKYIPMYGVTIAFKDYNVFKGMLESPWVGFKVFEKIFASKNFWHSVKNTLVLNLLTLAVNFPLTIFVALMLNEVIHLRFKKMIQSILYLPHFISWVVVAGIAANMFTQRDGTINLVLNSLGISSIPFSE